MRIHVTIRDRRDLDLTPEEVVDMLGNDTATPEGIRKVIEGYVHNVVTEDIYPEITINGTDLDNLVDETMELLKDG